VLKTISYHLLPIGIYVTQITIFMKMVSNEIRNLARQIFKINPHIEHLGLIDLEGHVLLDQSAAAPEPIEPDEQRMMFYYQVGLRRSRREHFNQAYGQTNYIHIVREKMQQLILYLPMITIYLTIDKTLSPDGIANIAGKTHELDADLVNEAIKSLFYLKQ
jgi:hypothetical protein